MKLKNSLSIFFFIAVLAFPPTVAAQEMENQDLVAETPNAQAYQEVTVPVERLVIQTEADKEQLDKLKAYYGEIVLSYRNQEREALLAQSQYEQIVTLSALEEAVTKTRSAIVTRDEVLATYVSLLFFELRDTVGVNLVQKNGVLSQLEQTFKDLKDHKARAEAATTREDITLLNEQFAEIGPQTQGLTGQASTLITVGRLQTVNDKGKTLTTDLEKALDSANLNPADLAKQKRALDVTKQLNEQIDEEFRKLYQRLEQSQTTSQWQNVQDITNIIYANLSQLVSYLQELSNQVK